MSGVDAIPQGPRPSSRVAGRSGYRVPRHPAPIDLHLDGNEGPAPDFATIQAGFPASGEAIRRYPSTANLTETIAKRLGVPANQVLVTNGGDDALDRAARAFLEAGRRLILPTPTFEMIGRYAESAGAALDRVPWLEGAFPVDAVLAKVTGQTGAIAVVTPNNPTGAVATADDLRRLSEGAPHAAIFVDLAYTEFAEIDLTDAALTLPNAIAFRTLSKAWGLAGLRVGYAVSTPEIIGWLRAAGNPYPVSAASLGIAQAVLDAGDGPRLAYATTVRGARIAMAQEAATLGIRMVPSQANFGLFRGVADPLWFRDAFASLGMSIRAFPGNAALSDAARITCPSDVSGLRRVLHGMQSALAPAAVATNPTLYNVKGRPDPVLGGAVQVMDGPPTAGAGGWFCIDRPADIAGNRAAGWISIGIAADRSDAAESLRRAGCARVVSSLAALATEAPKWLT